MSRTYRCKPLTPDDPRHGTNAGSIAHRRQGIPPCRACLDAANKAAKRYRVAREQDRGGRLPLGEDAWHVLRTRVASELAVSAGLAETTIRRLRASGPETRVARRTRDKILAAPPPPEVTTPGLVRRLQALAAIGWSALEIQRRHGIWPDHLRDLRRSDPADRVFVRPNVRAAILAAWDELHMTPAPASRGSNNVRAYAKRRGWAPPLAWENIDDPDEQPVGVRDEHAPPRSPEAWEARVDVLRLLVETGGTLADAAKRLDMSRDALWAWCKNHGHDDLYLALSSRSVYRNQWTEAS